MNYNFPKQNHKTSIPKLAEKYNKSIPAMKRIMKKGGFSKTRAQYEHDAKIRRETAFKLRQDGLKFKDIAEILGISLNNAQQLVRRYEVEVALPMFTIDYNNSPFPEQESLV